MKFIVEGKPQGKARARTFYNRQRGKMQSMTPQNTVDYENLVRWSYKAAGGTYYDKTPLNVSVRAIYDIPASYSKKKREAAARGEIKPSVKPDVDNIAKAILDALNGVAYYDDSGVIELKVSKEYGDSARVEVEIEILGE